MKNEPVAWMFKLCFHPTKMALSFEKPSKKHYPNPIPLYTHPAKTLTDEVLMQLYEVADYSPESYLEEARAILRKASEK